MKRKYSKRKDKIFVIVNHPDKSKEEVQNIVHKALIREIQRKIT